MKRSINLLSIIICLFLTASGLFGQEKKNEKSIVNTQTEELKDYESYNHAALIDADINKCKQSYEQRVEEIKYILGLIGITNDNIIKEAVLKDAVCTKLDTAIRVLADQKTVISEMKIYKKKEKNK